MAQNGLVFAGGGGKGAYQIGVWEALISLGFGSAFDVTVGTSAGALNASLYAQQDISIAKNVWSRISNDKIMTTDSDNRNSAGLFSHTGLSTLLRTNVSQQKIVANNINCYVCASDSSTEADDGMYKSHFFCLNQMPSEEFYNALLASSALPVVFGKVSVSGREYRDGGIIVESNTPYHKALSLGCKKILVINLCRGTNHSVSSGNAQILFLYPSKDLGDIFSGTVDFSSNGASFRMKMGYTDTISAKNLLIDFLGKKDIKKSLNITQKDVDCVLRGK